MRSRNSRSWNRRVKMAGKNNDAYPSAGGHIRRVDADEMRILLRGNAKKPVGWFIARMEDGSWTGADTHFGAIPKRLSGSFKEVIEWLIPPTGVVRNITWERETNWKAAVSDIVPLRIPGAEIKEWPYEEFYTVQGLDGTQVAGRDAAFLARSRLRGGQRTGALLTAEVMERDRRILELFRDGKTYREIGEAVGLTEGTVSSAIKRMQEADPTIPQGIRQRNMEEIAARDAEIRLLLLDGKSQKQISRELGLSVHRVSDRVDVMRKKGILTNLPTHNERLQAEKAERAREAVRLMALGMDYGEIASELGVRESTVRHLIREVREEGGVIHGKKKK